MEYIFLCLVVLLISFQNFISKQYSTRASQFNVWLFSGTSTLGALLFFIVNAGFKIEYVPEVIPFSILFAICFGLANVGCVMAVKNGMFSISTLVNSYSLLIPTLYGIIFLNDAIYFCGYVGIALLLFSIYLLNKKKEDTHFTITWFFWILIAFLGDGFCSTLQKIQQLHFEGMYKNQLMIYALFVLTIIFLIAGVLTSKGIKKELPKAAGYGLVRGVANGIVNYLVMVLTGVLPNAILFPLISAGGIVISFVLATMLYRERLTKLQLVGYIAGIASVILLNF